MNKLFTNRIIETIAKTILFFASVHIIILVIHVLITHDIGVLDVLRILQIDLIMPFYYTSASFMSSLLFLAAIFFVIYRYFTGSKKE